MRQVYEQLTIHRSDRKIIWEIPYSNDRIIPIMFTFMDYDMSWKRVFIGFSEDDILRCDISKHKKKKGGVIIDPNRLLHDGYFSVKSLVSLLYYLRYQAEDLVPHRQEKVGTQ